jgi:hypothetical protein
MRDAGGHQLVEVPRLDCSVQVMSQREAMQLARHRQSVVGFGVPE